jgi:hypothetical protein
MSATWMLIARPASDTGVVDDPVRLRVAFPCQREACQHAAAIVEVIRRGQLYVDDEQDILYRIFPDAQGTLRLSGFLPYTSFSTQVINLAATLGAVRGTNAAALHAMDRTWVPFYCQLCERSFCGEHWNLKATFGWGFDFYSGTCPVGHAHFIDHR